MLAREREQRVNRAAVDTRGRYRSLAMQARTINITWVHALMFRIVLVALMTLAVVRAFGQFHPVSPPAVDLPVEDPPASSDSHTRLWGC